MSTKDFYAIYNNIRRDIFKKTAFTIYEEEITEIFNNYDYKIFEIINTKENMPPKTLISFCEAAEKIGWNTKSLYNRVSEYKKQFGIEPPFIHRVNGKGAMKVIPTKFDAWVLNHKQSGRKQKGYTEEFSNRTA